MKNEQKLYEIVEKYIEQDELNSAKNFLFENIQNICTNSYDAISSKKNIHLAHYTSLETIYSILEKQKKYKNKKNKESINKENGLRLYDVDTLNDPTEGKIISKSLLTKRHDYLKNAEDAKSSDIINTFICSFVSGAENIGDKLQYWQSYGQDGLGCSIQLSPKQDKKKFYEVFYNEKIEESIINKYLDLGKELHKKLPSKEQENFANNIFKSINWMTFLYKSADYEQEKEYRYIQTSSENIKFHFKEDGPYLREYILSPDLNAEEFLITNSKITIGPRVHDSDRICKYLKALAEQAGLPGPCFKPSKIKYRKIW